MVWTSIGPTPQNNSRDGIANATASPRAGDIPGNISGRSQALGYSPDINARLGVLGGAMLGQEKGTRLV